MRSSDEYYFGEWNNGKRHGIGKSKSRESRYLGEWQDDMPHGTGFLTPHNKPETLLRYDRGVFVGPVIIGINDFRAKFSKYNLQEFAQSSKIKVEQMDAEIRQAS